MIRTNRTKYHQGTTVRRRADSPWRTWAAPKAFEAGKPSFLELSVRLSLSQRERTEVRDRSLFAQHRDLLSENFFPVITDAGSGPREITNTESKAHKRDRIFPAPGTLLSAALRAGVVTLVNLVIAQGTRLPRHPKIKEITNRTRNITNRSFAMPADAAAIPPNPKTAATSAIIRNNTAQPNISSPPLR